MKKLAITLGLLGCIGLLIADPSQKLQQQTTNTLQPPAYRPEPQSAVFARGLVDNGNNMILDVHTNGTWTLNNLGGQNTYASSFVFTTPTAARTFTFPNASGTVQLNPSGLTWAFAGATYSNTFTVTEPTVGNEILTVPDFAGVADTFVFVTLAQTLLNKTLTAPTINGGAISAAVNSDTKVLVANFTANSGGTGSTLTTLTGLSWTVVAGATYKFRCVVPVITQTSNGGAKMAFKLTPATLTSVNLRVRASTDTDNTGAVSTSFTTTTDQATWFDQKTAVYTYYLIEGTLVVGTGGTIAVQAAQNTSHVDTTTITLGAFAEMIRTL